MSEDAGMTHTSPNAENPLVLVAYEAGSDRKAIGEVLENFGYRVLTAANGKDAVDILTRTRPDAVLLDVKIPGLEWHKVCKVIRTQATGQNIPIILVTERDDDKSIARAYRFGATDTIDKPVCLPVLPFRIENALTTARSLSDLTGLIRAIPDLIFIVNEDGEVQDGLSGPDATHTLQIKALTTASEINFYPCENDDTARPPMTARGVAAVVQLPWACRTTAKTRQWMTVKTSTQPCRRPVSSKWR